MEDRNYIQRCGIAADVFIPRILVCTYEGTSKKVYEKEESKIIAMQKYFKIHAQLLS